MGDRNCQAAHRDSRNQGDTPRPRDNPGCVDERSRARVSSEQTDNRISGADRRRRGRTDHARTWPGWKIGPRFFTQDGCEHARILRPRWGKYRRSVGPPRFRFAQRLELRRLCLFWTDERTVSAAHRCAKRLLVRLAALSSAEHHLSPLKNPAATRVSLTPGYR